MKQKIGLRGLNYVFHVFTLNAINTYDIKYFHVIIINFILQENYGKSIQHNRSGVSTYTVGINQFSDLTTQEFKDNYLGQQGHSFVSQSSYTLYVCTS